MNILFVENHAIFAKTVSNQFLSEHNVTVVPTVSLALAALNDPSKSFDVLLVDYDLDDAKGDELVRAVTEAHVDLKIIATSAHQRGNSALVEAGAHAVCPKMEFNTIRHIIEKLFA